MSDPVGLILLADVLTPGDLFDALGSGFRGDRAKISTSEQVQFLVLLILVGLGGWGLSRLVAGQEKLRRCNHPGKLFRELCRAHALGWRDRWLLADLAKARGCHQPSEVFLHVEHFHREGLDGAWQARLPRLAELARELFVWPAEPAESPRSPGGDSG